MRVDEHPAAGRDDAAAIEAAIGRARAGGGPLLFAARDYRIGRTIALPSGIVLIGAGATRKRDAEVPGTTFVRTADTVLLDIEGDSFKRGRKLKQSIAIERIAFVGGDFASDMIQARAVLRLQIRDCLFSASKGRHLFFWEVFDSRITNTDFESGGSDITPMIELKSGGDWEFTNQVQFLGCRCESYPGTALALTGTNTNEITIAHAKFESAMSAQPAITLERAQTIHLDGVQIFSAGPKDRTINAQIAARDCQGIFGTLFLEHRPNARGGAKLRQFLALDRCQAVDLTAYVYDGLEETGLDRVVGGDRARQASVRIVGRNGDAAQSRLWRME